MKLIALPVLWFVLQSTNTFGFKGNIEVNICAAVKHNCGTREILHTLALAICGLEVSSIIIILFYFFLVDYALEHRLAAW